VFAGDHDPDADLHGQVDALDVERHLQGCRERERDRGHVVRPVHVGEQDRELVPAQAGDGVDVSQHTGQARPDLAEQLVAEVVAEGVVDLLEPVEVDDQQSGAGPGPAVSAQRLPEVVGQQLAVR